MSAKAVPPAVVPAEPPAAPDPNTLWTPDECAAFLKLPVRQLGRLGVPSVKFGHRTLRYSVAAVLAWLAAPHSPKPRKHKGRKGARS